MDVEAKGGLRGSIKMRLSGHNEYVMGKNGNGGAAVADFVALSDSRQE